MSMWQARMLTAIIALAIAVRIAAMQMLKLPLESDALSYFTMAQGLAERGELTDNFGQHVFYSAGYPLLLTPFFMVFGSKVGVALAVNLLLTAMSSVLVYRLAVALSGHFEAGLIAATGFALWLPGAWNAGMVAKENFSTPLLLALTLCAVQIARGTNAPRWALSAGLAWGAIRLPQPRVRPCASRSKISSPGLHRVSHRSVRSNPRRTTRCCCVPSSACGRGACLCACSLRVGRQPTAPR